MVEGKDIKTAFGLAVKESRHAKGISQEKLAEHANLDRSYISELERGLKSASIVTLYKLSDALEISPEKLIQITDLKRSES